VNPTSTYNIIEKLKKMHIQFQFVPFKNLKFHMLQQCDCIARSKNFVCCIFFFFYSLNSPSCPNISYLCHCFSTAISLQLLNNPLIFPICFYITFKIDTLQPNTNMAALQVSKLASVLARCLPSDLKNAAKFKVKVMEFDTHLNMVSFGCLLFI
jgi:hypothetical protein